MAQDLLPLDNNYEVLTVDLGIERVAPGIEITNGILGVKPVRSLVIWKLTGSCYIRLNSLTNAPLPFEAFPWGSGATWDHDILHVFVTNSAQPGKTLVFYVGRAG